MGNVLDVNRSVSVRASSLTASGESKVVGTIGGPDTASRSSHCWDIVREVLTRGREVGVRKETVKRGTPALYTQEGAPKTFSHLEKRSNDGGQIRTRVLIHCWSGQTTIDIHVRKLESLQDLTSYRKHSLTTTRHVRFLGGGYCKRLRRVKQTALVT